jgi:hypothetical protein
VDESEALIMAEGERATIKSKFGKEKKMLMKETPKKSNIKVDTHLDPINSLGFGIVAYRDLLYSLIWAFTFFSLLSIPTIYIYSNGGGYYSSKLGWEVDSLGNLGYSSVQCASIPLGVETLVISCPYGTVG